MDTETKDAIEEIRKEVGKKGITIQIGHLITAAVMIGGSLITFYVKTATQLNVINEKMQLLTETKAELKIEISKLNSKIDEVKNKLDEFESDTSVILQQHSRELFKLRSKTPR